MKKLIALFVVIYIGTMCLAAWSAFAVGRDSVAEEAMRYIYEECTK